ncbi:MAG TPA: tRNA (adenosine(37)-N6)-threonylcarbamoyltransferase complex ATPase subunit type 1 TsaE [Dehalococcoidia bacterium]|jgi:tRNA threonylcarbamoyladenosine biosynthesis protein TsaE|nr:tRNA (adenosine(37)-N6)-threonylcarbamoyltransferase complex ATPase subunit type 1 TsaE [Dehalococcoidia bacterium]
MSISFETSSPAETQRLGRHLATHLREGDVLLLSGELGAGKTCFAQGIGAGLKVKEAVKSSSFVLVNEYNGRLHVYHADLFRLEDPVQIFELGLEENASDGLLLIEWPDRAMQEMPPEHLMVRFDSTGPKSRRISFEAEGQRYLELLDDFVAKERPHA